MKKNIIIIIIIIMRDKKKNHRVYNNRLVFVYNNILCNVCDEGPSETVYNDTTLYPRVYIG